MLIATYATFKHYQFEKMVQRLVGGTETEEHGQDLYRVDDAVEKQE
jgi:hypothetical protein